MWLTRELFSIYIGSVQYGDISWHGNLICHLQVSFILKNDTQSCQETIQFSFSQHQWVGGCVLQVSLLDVHLTVFLSSTFLCIHYVCIKHVCINMMCYLRHDSEWMSMYDIVTLNLKQITEFRHFYKCYTCTSHFVKVSLVKKTIFHPSSCRLETKIGPGHERALAQIHINPYKFTGSFTSLHLVLECH